MATFEERETIDYTMKKLEKVLNFESFMIKDLDKMHNRIRKQEERLKRIIRTINSLEKRIECLEKEDNVFESSSNEETSE